MVSSSLELIIKRFRENKLSHAFLLDTNNLDMCLKDVKELIKIINCPKEYNLKCHSDCNLCNLIDSNNLPSLIVIEPDGLNIKKEQILSMMDKFDTNPVYSKYNCYIIMNADKLNNYSANTILKFLEEPEDGIIGFFIVNNIENILPTIKSRCQVFSCIYDENINVLDDYLDEVKIYLNSIYKSKDDLLYNKTYMVGKYSERNDWIIFFKTMLLYIKECFEEKRSDKVEFVSSLERLSLVQIILVLEDILKYINSNVNIDLILDRFVLEMRKFYE